MKENVDYKIDLTVKKEVVETKNCVLENIINCDIYLFGSIAKGRYKKSSDIDILVLIDDNKDLKELRKLRHFIEDKIDGLNLEREVDIKLYNKKRYFNLTESPCFEREILKDLVSIKEWEYGK